MSSPHSVHELHEISVPPIALDPSPTSIHTPPPPRDGWADAKVKKIALYAFSCLAAVFGCVCVGIGIVYSTDRFFSWLPTPLIANLSAPWLPIPLFVLSALFVAGAVGLFFKAWQTQDYDNQLELHKIQQSAKDVPFSQLMKHHGLENIIKYSLVPQQLLQQRFEEQMEPLSFSQIVGLLSLETIKKYGLSSEEFLQRKFMLQMQERQFSEIIALFPLETIKKYELSSEEFLQRKFMLQMQDPLFSAIIALFPLETIAQYHLDSKNFLQGKFQKEMDLCPLYKIVGYYPTQSDEHDVFLPHEGEGVCRPEIIPLFSLETIAKYHLASERFLQEKFLKEVTPLRFSEMVRQYSLETIATYRLASKDFIHGKFDAEKEFLQKQFQEEMKDLSFSQIIARCPLESIAQYPPAPWPFFQKRFEKEMADLRFSEIIAKYPLDAITNHSLASNSFMQKRFGDAVANLNFSEMVKRYPLQMINTHHLLSIPLLQKKYLAEIQGQCNRIQEASTENEAKENEAKEKEEWFTHLLYGDALINMKTYSLVPPSLLSICEEFIQHCKDLREKVQQLAKKYPSQHVFEFLPLYPDCEPFPPLSSSHEAPLPDPFAQELTRSSKKAMALIRRENEALAEYDPSMKKYLLASEALEQELQPLRRAFDRTICRLFDQFRDELGALPQL